MPRVKLPGRRVLPALLVGLGLLLRLYFLHYRAFVAGDSVLYMDIAQNWIIAHVYGLSTDTLPRPTLIRLPGYALVLAACRLLFPHLGDGDTTGPGAFLPILWLQVAADLATCLLLARLAQKRFGRRAGLFALAAGTLCPFLANYTAVPLTETFAVCLVAAAYFSVDAWRETRSLRWLYATGAALAYSILLRPDQGLLAVAALPLFKLPARESTSNRWHGWRPLLVCAVLTFSPLVPWTVRNAVTFHVFQPLAPKLANDPGEAIPLGFQRWYRTFAVDFASTEDAYWKYPEETVALRDLPARAFDSQQQREETDLLLHEAAALPRLQPAVDDGFGQLAAERIAASPLRYYVALPVARLANMLLHPRVEMLPVAERWWQYRAHPGQTLFAWTYGLLGAAYLAAAVAGLPRARHAAPALTASLCAFILLRCALLLTLDNAEQRYTIEFFPVYILLASALFRERMPPSASEVA